MRQVVIAIFIVVTGVGTARAQQACVDPVNLPNPVYLSFGETQIPLIKELGKNLRDSENITLVFRSAGSCTNLDALYNNVAITTNLSYIPAGYDGKATPPTCTPPAGGVVPDLSDSVVFVDACPLTKPAGVGDFFAAAQPFSFVVPLASSQQAITAEEAYFLFGFGAPVGMVTPWSDPALAYILPVSKGTILNLGAIVNVPAAKWQGTVVSTLDQLAINVGTSTKPDATIGILGSGTYEEHRSTIRPLAFRAFKQYHAYYPNSTLTALDKRPMRDGHYVAWSYTHWLARVDANNVVVNPVARRVIQLIVGEAVTPAPAFDPLLIQIHAHFAPVCAMHVKRDFEGGDLSLFQPPEPCDCFFDSQTGTPGPTCSICADDSTCGTGKCRHNFCEPR
jgi:hypothetical protein